MIPENDDATPASTPAIGIVYRGENGDGWVPKSKRDLWNYAVRTGQVVVPPALDDGGDWPDGQSFDTGDTIDVSWIPPEYAGRIHETAPPPQPTYFTITGDDR